MTGRWTRQELEELTDEQDVARDKLTAWHEARGKSIEVIRILRTSGQMNGKQKQNDHMILFDKVTLTTKDFFWQKEKKKWMGQMGTAGKPGRMGWVRRYC